MEHLVGGPLAATLPLEMFFSMNSQIETSGLGLGRAEAGARGLNLRTPLENPLKDYGRCQGPSEFRH